MGVQPGDDRRHLGDEAVKLRGVRHGGIVMRTGHRRRCPRPGLWYQIDTAPGPRRRSTQRRV
jgi:hypothetical protein